MLGRFPSWVKVFLSFWFIIWSFLCTKGLYSVAQVSGSKFYYLKNEAVLLEMALVNWAISEVSKKGFTPLITPEIVRSSVVEKCGFQPRAKNTQVGTPLFRMGFKV
jgi:seryl-tRNA synthetase